MQYFVYNVWCTWGNPGITPKQSENINNCWK